jgi:hypothetical protein
VSFAHAARHLSASTMSPFARALIPCAMASLPLLGRGLCELILKSPEVVIDIAASRSRGLGSVHAVPQRLLDLCATGRIVAC